MQLVDFFLYTNLTAWRHSSCRKRTYKILCNLNTKRRINSLRCISLKNNISKLKLFLKYRIKQSTNRDHVQLGDAILFHSQRQRDAVLFDQHFSKSCVCDFIPLLCQLNELYLRVNGTKSTPTTRPTLHSGRKDGSACLAASFPCS